jgi:hypothetical protein
MAVRKGSKREKARRKKRNEERGERRRERLPRLSTLLLSKDRT